MSRRFNDDDDLKSFLRAYAPVPPPSLPGEREKIAKRLGLRGEVSPFGAWMALGAASMAAVMGAFLVTPKTETHLALRPAAIESGVKAEDMELMPGILPTLSVGAEYLELAGG